MIPGIGGRDPAAPRLPVWLLVGWIGLVLSASLYPFDWDWGRLLAGLRDGLPRLQAWNPPSRRDTVVNLLLYVPFGLLGALALDARGKGLGRLVWPVVGAAALSLAVEVAQHALPPRDPALADWVFNTVSAAAGVALAVVWRTLPRSRFAGADEASRGHGGLGAGPALGVLAALWIAAHLAPFVPRLRPGRVSAALEASLALELSPSRVLAWFSCYLVLAAALRAASRWRHFWSVLLTATVASLGLRLLFVGQQLSPDEVLGALIALPTVALVGMGRLRWDPTRVFRSACLAVLAAGLWPTAATVVDVSDTAWLPFAELAGAASDPGSLPAIERLFLGIGLAWLAWCSRTRRLTPLLIVFAVAALVEFLQQWVPGRLPDTTDLAALLIGAALVQAAPPSTRRA
jgi:VanZ family protein